jgi:ATP-dependent DNA helicase RecG
MDERIYTGPIDQQLTGALSYIRNNVIEEKVFKVAGQPESVRIKNYSYEAIEEFLSNAVYEDICIQHIPHKDSLSCEP